MTSISRRGFLAGSAGILAAATVQAAEEGRALKTNGSALRAGVAVRDITPESGVAMWGYSDREGPSTGVLDPLMARALILESGDERIALVAMDLGRVPMPGALDRIRQRVKSTGVTRAIFCASHTHGGPVMEADDQLYAQKIERLLGDAIEEAAGRLVDAQLGVGTTTIDISHNRRFIQNGRCYMMWRNAERLPTQPIDHEAGIIRIDGAAGEPIAVLVNYACHPVVLGGDNREYTADWPGEMARLVKESTGAECFFLQGGAGDINPYLDKTPRSEGGVESMRATGREAADAVLAALQGIESAPCTAPALHCTEDSVEIGTRWDFTDPAVQQAFFEIYGDRFNKYVSRLTPDLAVKISTLVIDDNLALCFMPGEMFVQYQLELKANSPMPKTFLVGYADDFFVYFPTIKDAAIGGYGGSTATFVGVGAGDKMVRQAAIQVGTLSGKFTKVPGASDFAVEDYPPPNA